MKKLREFLKFDIERFLDGKDIRVLASEPWKEYKDSKGEIVGTKYKAIILTDNTNYKETEEKDINAGEALTIKVNKEPKNFKKFSKVELIGAEATVYGDYSNLLSIKAKDINFIEK